MLSVNSHSVGNSDSWRKVNPPWMNADNSSRHRLDGYARAINLRRCMDGGGALPPPHHAKSLVESTHSAIAKTESGTGQVRTIR